MASSLNRVLLIGSAGVGVDLRFSSFDTVGPTGVSQSDENNFGVFMSYQRPLFEDRIGFSSSVRYSFNDGESDWSQIQLNAGLSMQF